MDHNRRIPRYARCALEALNLSEPSFEGLRHLDRDEWNAVLALADTSQLTLLLGSAATDALPVWVRHRICVNRKSYAVRYELLRTQHAEILAALAEHDVEAVTIKGFTHSPELTPDPIERHQGDIDLWVLHPEDVSKAYSIITRLGYQPHGHSERRHLAPLVRPSSWEWSGDYFASDLPVPVEVHHCLWDEEQAMIGEVPEEDFWNRRVRRCVSGIEVTTLCPADNLAFAALHLLMHLLHGDLRLQRSWEIAHFLHHHANCNLFWQDWKRLHPPGLRALEAVVFSLCAEWFNSAMPNAVAEAIAELPQDVQLWLREYTWSPVENLFHPNKDELWLHLAMLPTFRSRCRVLTQRLFPVSAAAIPNAVQLAIEPGSRTSVKDALLFLRARAIRHLRLLFPALWTGLRWWALRIGLGRQFALFLLVSSLFNFGAFIFFLLHNLYLLHRGYHEDLIGQLQSAMTAGTVVCAIPAAMLARWKGLRTAQIIGMVGGAFSMAVRVTANSTALLLLSAFLNGVFFSVWAVTLPPMIASLTSKRNRASGFGVFSALSIGIGIVANLVGGNLPSLFGRLHAGDSAQNDRLALLAGIVLLCSAVIPAMWLANPGREPESRLSYPRNPFILRFFVAIAIWSFATAAFNTFTNTYLMTVSHLSVAAVGKVFSAGQAVQVIGVLAVPLVFPRIGYFRGIALTQIGTAITLLLFAVLTGGLAGPILYVAYSCFQYSNEPAVLHMLMSGVTSSERNGASALHFIVVSVAASAASLMSGNAITRWGYTAVLPVAALLAAVAAVFFLLLPRPDAPV